MDLTTEQQLTKGQRTAGKILEATTRCISKVGIEKTSITAIAKEADVKRSLVAYHFPKKDEIFYMAMKHILSEVIIHTQDVKKYTGKKHLTRFVFSLVDYFLSRPHYFNCFLHFFYVSSIDDDFKRLNTEYIGRTTGRIINCLEEILAEENIPSDPEILREFADGTYVSLIGAITMFFSTTHQYTKETFEKRYHRVFLARFELFIHALKQNA